MKTYEQEMVPIGTLVLADYNPREISAPEFERLKASLREFGFVQPVAARREDNLVLGGHQRLAAARAVLTEDGSTPEQVDATLVPVAYVAGLSDGRAKALNLALNKISGTWDFDKLAGLLETMGAEDVALSGFSSDEASEVIDMIGRQNVADNQRALDDAEEEAQRDVDAELAAEARKFTFEVATDEDASLVREALTACGMVGGVSGPALARMARIVLGKETA